MAHQLFKAKVHIGYLAAIVAASNAGGSGSVVGDTTTSMLWISGVSPLQVLDAYIAAIVAVVMVGVVAAKQQQAYSPMIKNAHQHRQIDWPGLGIVGLILMFAIATNVFINSVYPEQANHFPFVGVSCLAGAVGHHPTTAARLGNSARDDKGNFVSAGAGGQCVHDAGRKVAGANAYDYAWAGLHFSRVRQHPTNRLGDQAGRL